MQNILIIKDYFLFELFGFERNWWKLFQKRIMCIKWDVYVFILSFFIKTKQCHV